MKFFRSALALGGLVLGLHTGAATAEVTLRGIYAFPKTFIFVEQFSRFVDTVNEQGKGIVQIRLVGGPEVVPPFEQHTAVRNGVFDIQMGPASYYGGIVPEADAIFAANVTPMEARERSATALLDEIWGRKINATFLAWIGGGVGFHVYTASEPKRTPDGGIDLSGMRFRSAAAYKEWFEKLGVTNVMMPGPEVYTALERGVVEGLGWPSVAFTDLGVHGRFIKYRIEPPVWTLDVAVIMNRDKWNSLPQQARDLLTRLAAEHEEDSYNFYTKRSQEELGILKEAGVETIRLEGDAAAKWVETAHDTLWERLESRDSTHLSELREKLYE